MNEARFWLRIRINRIRWRLATIVFGRSIIPDPGEGTHIVIREGDDFCTTMRVSKFRLRYVNRFAADAKVFGDSPSLFRAGLRYGRFVGTIE